MAFQMLQSEANWFVWRLQARLSRQHKEALQLISDQLRWVKTSQLYGMQSSHSRLWYDAWNRLGANGAQ